MYLLSDIKVLIHNALERKNSSDKVENNRKNNCNKSTVCKTNGSVGVGERINKKENFLISNQSQ